MSSDHRQDKGMRGRVKGEGEASRGETYASEGESVLFIDHRCATMAIYVSDITRDS